MYEKFQIATVPSRQLIMYVQNIPDGQSMIMFVNPFSKCQDNLIKIVMILCNKRLVSLIDSLCFLDSLVFYQEY